MCSFISYLFYLFWGCCSPCKLHMSYIHNIYIVEYFTMYTLRPQNHEFPLPVPVISWIGIRSSVWHAEVPEAQRPLGNQAVHVTGSLGKPRPKKDGTREVAQKCERSKYKWYEVVPIHVRLKPSNHIESMSPQSFKVNKNYRPN